MHDEAGSSTAHALKLKHVCPCIPPATATRRRCCPLLLLLLMDVQLARAGVTENVFALCYGFPEGGTMLLGGCGLPWLGLHV
jgi:hypothetical protein